MTNPGSEVGRLWLPPEAGQLWVPPEHKVSVIGFSESKASRADGVSGTTRELFTRMHRAGHSVVLAVPGPEQEGDADLEYPILYMRSHHFEEYDYDVGIPTNREVRDIIKQHDYDVVVHFSPVGRVGKASILGAQSEDKGSVALYMSDMPRFLKRMHKGYASPYVAWRILNLHKKVDRTLVPSSPYEKMLIAGGVDADRVAIMGRGVDAYGIFNPANYDLGEVEEIRDRVVRQAEKMSGRKAPKDPIIVGYMGRIAQEKQIERMRTFERARERGFYVIDHLIGGGSEQNVKNIRSVLGSMAVLEGEKRGSELGLYCQVMDIGFHGGTDETFGQSMLQLMASGKPMLVPDTGGQTDFAKHGRNALHHKDDQDLLERFFELAKDPDRRKAMGHQAREDAKLYTWDAIAGQFVGHCVSVRDGSRVAASNFLPEKVAA